MKVPKNKTIWIGNKCYKAGNELPADYNFPEKKKEFINLKEVSTKK